LEASKCENVLVADVDKSRFREQTVNIDVVSCWKTDSLCRSKLFSCM